MKKVFSVVVLISLGFICHAQQKPYYSQYILNNYILNPAVAGIENYTDFKASYRKQWSGIDGAPVTSYVTIHKPIGKTDHRSNATSLEAPRENNPYKSSVLESFEAPSKHHGIGFTAISDKTGYISRTTFGLTYAYHMPVSEQATLSVGFTAGVTNVNLDKTKIVWGSLDPNDPAIGFNSGEIMKTMPEFSTGLWLYSKNYFVGASVLNIVPGKVQFVKNDLYGESYHPHIFLQAGYRFFLSDDVSILPSVLIQQISPLPTFIHTNVKLQYQDLVWVGAGYRVKDELSGASAMLGVNIAHSVSIGYSYNTTTNARLKTYAGNTNEIVLGISLGKREAMCPTNVW
jgi:type IX secretion system PorP/SprF family membrane protein